MCEIAYLKDEAGAEVVERHLAGEEEAIAHAANLCEVCYECLHDEDAVRLAVESLKDDGLVVREDIEEPFWKEIGRLKCISP